MSEQKIPPRDYLQPEWHWRQSVHNWRNYISEEVQAMWLTFTPEQRAALARNADEIAGREEWD